MLTISLGAMSHLGDLLREARVPREVAIRLVLHRREHRLALRLDHFHQGDVEWKQGDRTVLVLGPRVHRLVANQHLQLSVDSNDHLLEFVAHRARQSA
jgi:hypothetical protein